MTLKDQVVLITGVTGGLGAPVTTAFLDVGASVVGVSRSVKQSDYDRPNFTAFATALSTGADADKAVQAAIGKFGRLDALVHLVGAFAPGTAAETDDATYDKMMTVNFQSAFLMIRAALRDMRGPGRIIAIGSKSAVEPSPGASVYAASKAALVSLIRGVAAEQRASGINANIILPGTMDTPANRAAMPSADPAKWVRPELVAGTAVFLASPAAADISGAAIPVYGREG